MPRATARARLAPAARAAALLAAAALAAGCASPAASPAAMTSVSATGPITFATGKIDTGYLPGLVARWNAAHPQQKVTVIYLPDESDEQHAQLAENLQARSDIYDVMNLDVVWTAEFASSNWIIPVSQSLVPLHDFLRPAVDTATYDGKLYAVPFTSNASLLYYRKDLVPHPPATWAQLEHDARTIAPRQHMAGYAGQFAAYEGLTVNFAEAVQSAGGSILSPDGSQATVNTPQAHQALSFLVDGFRQGWIPQAALGYDEEASRRAFEAGHLLFLSNWPYVYGDASKPGPGNKVAGRFGVTTLPGQGGPGSSSLGGANLAVSAFSRHQATALAFIKFLTSLPSERRVLIDAALPPVWTRLYENRALIRRFPYLPVLRKAIAAAQPRPKIADYNQLSLAISSAVHRALAQQVPVSPTLAGLNGELSQIVRTG
ncbi:MAG TPA: ABC transporter substrate-binding protein [Streptosporangiaceae bacterium]|nr:ABC transporter substrate-binding protein [Streptosporangiaceae bacterium]